MSAFALTVTCRSTRGIVATISTYLAESGCNITDSAQFDDRETGNFFMRISFNSETGTTLEQLSEGFGERARPLGMDYAFHDETARMKASIEKQLNRLLVQLEDLEEFREPPGFFRWVFNNGFSSPPPIAGLLMRTAKKCIRS